MIKQLAVFVKTGAQEAPTTSSGGKCYPAEQPPDLTQSALPKRYGRGMNTRRRRESVLLIWQATLGPANLPFSSCPFRYSRSPPLPESGISPSTSSKSYAWPPLRATAYLSKHTIRFTWDFLANVQHFHNNHRS